MGPAANFVPGSKEVQRRHVNPGDVIVDLLNRDYFRVDVIRPASAKGYVVFQGHDLLANKPGQTSGNRTGNVRIRVHDENV
jgi:hypothetical protein